MMGGSSSGGYAISARRDNFNQGSRAVEEISGRGRELTVPVIPTLTWPFGMFARPQLHFLVPLPTLE